MGSQRRKAAACYTPGVAVERLPATASRVRAPANACARSCGTGPLSGHETDPRPQELSGSLEHVAAATVGANILVRTGSIVAQLLAQCPYVGVERFLA